MQGSTIHTSSQLKAGQDIIGKSEYVTGKKKFKRESLVY
jgi:hypothetical protein